MRDSRLDIGYRVHDLCGAVGEALCLLARGHARKDQYSLKAALYAHHDIGVHAVAYHHRVFRVRVDHAERRTQHQGVGFSNVVRRPPGGALDQRGNCTSSGYYATVAWAYRVRVRAYEARSRADKADRLGDALEAISSRFPDYHVLRVVLGKNITNIVQRGCQARLAD